MVIAIAVHRPQVLLTSVVRRCALAIPAVQSVAGQGPRRSLRDVIAHRQFVVLGGGVAGIAAACRLAECGFKPLLVEARPFLGGRARSFLHEGSGDEIDNGQHLMMGCYHQTFRLLSLLGTRDLVSILRPLTIEFRDASGSVDHLIVPTNLPGPVGLLIGVRRMRGLSVADRRAVIRLGVAARLSRPSIDETVHQWLCRHHQSARLIERLWEPMAIATMNTPISTGSAKIFVAVLRRGFLAWGDDARLALPRVGLSRLLQPARQYIESRGGAVVAHKHATQITRRDEGGFALRIGDGDLLHADGVISAMTRAAVSRMLGVDRLAAIDGQRSMRTAPIVSVYLWYDRNPNDIPILCGMVGSRVQWVFNRRRIVEHNYSSRYPGLLSCTISAAFAETAMSSNDVVTTADAELRRAFPSLGGAALMDALTIKEKHATFLATPEHERLRPGTVTAWPGLCLAGDWTDTGLPATIEGAIDSGYRAANALMQRQGARG